MTLAVQEKKELPSPPRYDSTVWENLLLAGTNTGTGTRVIPGSLSVIPAPGSTTSATPSYVASITWIEEPRERPLFLSRALTTSYHYIDPRETEKYRERAFGALRTLVQRFPRARAALMWAIREGKIDGTTYLPSDYMSNPLMKKEDMAEHAEEARCIIGWVMVAMGTDYPYERALSVEHRGDLEAFVIDINPGETHQSNRWLGMLYHVLEEMQV